MQTIKLFLALTICLAAHSVTAQVDSTDLMSEIEQQVSKEEQNSTEYMTATFKSTRLIDGHTIENLPKGILDFRISHRFGKINGGGYDLFGLDNATMRMSFDYGITNRFMIGIGRSTFEKTYDGFVKVKLLRQATGVKRMPVTVSYVPTVAIKTQRPIDTIRKNSFSSRLYYTHQILVARKFSEQTSLQLMPTYSHRNVVTFASEPNDLIAIGIGGRQKLGRRVSFNAEYYYQLPDYKLNGTTNALSLGFDIETGGHVFQLHFTNSQGMSERTFITETRGKWGKGDIYFGFNISRVFTVGKRR